MPPPRSPLFPYTTLFRSPARAPSTSSFWGSEPAAESTGASPNKRLVASESTKAKTRTRPSTRIEWNCGRLGGRSGKRVATPPVSHECSDKAAKQPEDGALGEQLAGDAPVAGAHRDSNRDFL